MTSRRVRRVNDLIREEISDLLRREVRDPRLGEVVSITQVEVSADFRSAKVYVSSLGDDEERERTLEGLRAAAGFLRRSLKPRLSLKTVPFLTFYKDISIEGAARMLSLIDDAAPPPSSPSPEP